MRHFFKTCVILGFVGLLSADFSVAESLTALPTEAANSSVIEITDTEIKPRELILTNDDLVVFLLNSSKESLISFEIEFGKREMHCSNDNIENLPSGTARSIRPLGPRDFSTTCFHEPGTYVARFFGVGGKKDPITATITLR